MPEKPSSTMLDESLIAPPQDAGDEEGNGGEEEAGKERVGQTPKPKDEGPAKEREGAPGKGKEEGRRPREQRIDELYGHVKRLETQLADKDKDLDVLRSHAGKLQRTVESFVSEKDKPKEEEPPNPVNDPEAYAAWMEARMKKDREEAEARTEQKVQQVRNETLLETQRDLHDDYDDIVRPVQRLYETGEMSEEIKKRIYEARNPFAAAYRYGKELRTTHDQASPEHGKEDEKKRAQIERERKAAIDQGSVEGAGRGPADEREDENEMSDDEKRVARLMGVSEKDYLKQRKHLRG
jgi:hypothetical protein